LVLLHEIYSVFFIRTLDAETYRSVVVIIYNWLTHFQRILVLNVIE
jgi:hypothetical protein